MPKIRTNRTKPPPEGFEEIEGVLDEYERKMRDGMGVQNIASK
jgi:bud site selection protein 31